MLLQAFSGIRQGNSTLYSVQIIVLTFFIETSDELSLDQTAQAAINSLIPMPTPATTSR